MKKIIFFILLVSAVSVLDASTVIGAECRVFSPRIAHVFSVRSLSLRNIGKIGSMGLKAGVKASLGYGFEKYTVSGSEALVYGPCFSVGPALGIRVAEKTDVVFSVCASGNYPHYPVIFRGEASVEVKYSFNERFSAGAVMSFMFPSVRKFGFDIPDTRVGAGLYCGAEL